MRLRLILAMATIGLACVARAVGDREVWVAAATRIAEPVLAHGAEGRLQQTLPMTNKNRASTASFEALARTLNGLAPWFELPPEPDTDEGRARARLLALAHRALTHAADPDSPDWVGHGKGAQPLVEYAFLAQAFLRSPTRLWGGLPEEVRGAWLALFRKSRAIRPFGNNWLLFAGEVEAFLRQATGECDRKRLYLGTARFLDGWYKGDGAYGDGPRFHFDYYNSFVIQPMLLDILAAQAALGDKEAEEALPTVRRRARRFANWLERLIAPDGSYPAFGRSLCYRMGAFHLLADVARRQEKLWQVPPGQIRAALTAVLRRQVTDVNFTEAGWLRMGFNGEQPGMCDSYINTGSLYLCTFVFLPLGLPADAPFWAEPARDWTSKRAWSGQPFPNDHAIE